MARQPQQVRLSSSGGESWIKRNALNVIGLPVVAVILFVFLPSFTPGEIHSIDYYDKKYTEEYKEREAKRKETK